MKTKPGLYRHYKGRTYFVVGEATHTESREVMVVYWATYAMDAGMFVRPASMFHEMVSVNGVEVPRFKYEGGEV